MIGRAVRCWERSGRIRTDLGGPKAPFSVEESIPKVIDVVVAKQGKPVWNISTGMETPFGGDHASRFFRKCGLEENGKAAFAYETGFA